MRSPRWTGSRPGIGERVGPLLGPPAPASFEGLVTALINELAAQPGDGEVLLVLDDYHLIGSQPVHASLGFLLEHRPPGLHLVLASRADPPLPLARLRARGQLAELRAARAAVHRRRGSGPAAAKPPAADLPDAAVAALADRTEGWAAGLQLAALSLRGQADVVGFVAAFTGSHRYVLDFLAEEVLERQSEQVRAFLLETSVLERLSGPLCDAVTGRAGSQALLEQAERAGLFLVPLDEVRGWWRYHHLFADLLRARLQQHSPAGSAGLHRNAAAWYEEHGLADDAIGHALAAGDAAWAARLIERHADELSRAAASVRPCSGGWRRCPPGWLAPGRGCCWPRRAWPCSAAGWRRLRTLLDAAERALAGAGEGAGSPTNRRPGGARACWPTSPLRSRSTVLTSPSSAATPKAGGHVSRHGPWPRLGEDEWMLASHARRVPGMAEWMRGRLWQAERGCRASIAQWRAVGQSAVAAWGYHHLAQIQRARGRLDVAPGTYQQALGSPRPGRPPARRWRRRTWAWPRWHTSGTSSIPPSATSPRASRSAASYPYTQPLATGLATLAMDPAGHR